MVDCSKYLKKFYMGVGVFFIIVIFRTFNLLPKDMSMILFFMIIVPIGIGSLVLMGPYLKCLEKNRK
jgi:hypothetical protein